jgi:hypothetical protein
MVQFPDHDSMTVEQTAKNEAARSYLIAGKYYLFDPPVRATGFPTGGRKTCKLQELEFDRGWYLGFKEGNHTFQGKPINDPRVIPTPRGYEDAPNLDEVLEGLRECYFNVIFTGGSKATLDPDQA